MNFSKIMFARKYHIEFIALRGRKTRKADRLKDIGTRYKQDTPIETTKKDDMTQSNVAQTRESHNH